MRIQGNAGFSLVDGLVAISVCSVLMLLAGPMFYRMASDQRVAEYSNVLSRTLNKARHAAMLEGKAVSVCSSADGQQCTATSWSKGYIVFADAGAAGVVDGSDRILHVVPGKESRLNVTLNGADLVRFQRNGAVVAGASFTQAPAVAHAPKPLDLLAALSPISTAHAADTLPLSPEERTSGLPEFRVCSGLAGRSVQLNAVGRVTTASVSCR